MRTCCKRRALRLQWENKGTFLDFLPQGGCKGGTAMNVEALDGFFAALIEGPTMNSDGTQVHTAQPMDF